MKPCLIKRSFEETCAVSVKRKKKEDVCHLHGHDFYELDVITAGDADHLLNGKQDRASVGSAFFLTPEDLHAYPATRALDILNVQFSGAAVSDAVLRPLIECKTRAFTLTDAAMARFDSVFSLLEDELALPTPSTDILCRLLEILLLTLKGSDGGLSSAPTVTAADMPRAVTYIHGHFKENPPLSALAALLSLNEKYFCVKFKEYTGKTYKEYLRERKLSYAKRLLLSSPLSVTEIAYECGYATLSHFNREFKREYGVSPLAVRRGENP